MYESNEENHLPDISDLLRFRIDGEEIDILDIFDQEVVGVIYDFMMSCTKGNMKMIDVIRAVSISGQCGILVNDNYKVLQAFLTGFLMGGAEYNLETKKSDVRNEMLKIAIAKICEDLYNQAGRDVEVTDCIELNPTVLINNMVMSHNKDVVKFFFKMHVTASNKLKEDESVASQEEIRKLRRNVRTEGILKPITNTLIKALKDYPKYAILSDFYMNEYVVKNVPLEEAKKIGEIFNISIA